MQTFPSDLDQRTPEWYEARKGLVTASSVGAILNLDPYREPRDVLRQMVRSYHKAEPEFTGNAATEYGTFSEPGAIVDFAMDAGYTVRKVGFMVHQSGWIGASPDGIVLDGQDGLALLEVKCPYRMRDPQGGTEHKPLSEYPHYYAQMQVQMLCANAQRCYFWQWASHATLLDLVHRDNVWLTKHLPPLREFYELYLSEIDNPEHLKPLRKEVETASVAKLREYDEVCDQLDFATTRKKEIIDELALAADGRDSLMCGRPFTKVEREGAVSYAQVVKKHCPDVDLEPYRGEANELLEVVVMSNVFAIVDFNTGATDGFYRDFETAQEMHSHFIKRGATNVVVVEVVKGVFGNRISDHVFWNRHPVGFTGYKEA